MNPDRAVTCKVYNTGPDDLNAGQCVIVCGLDARGVPRVRSVPAPKQGQPVLAVAGIVLEVAIQRGERGMALVRRDVLPAT